MKRTLLFVLALVAVGCAELEAQQTIDLSELITQGKPNPHYPREGGLYLDPRTLEPYTGPVLELHKVDRFGRTLVPPGKVGIPQTVKSQGTLKAGKWDGRYLEYYDDSNLKWGFTLKDGVRHGLYAYYHRDGIPIEKGMLHMGVYCGEWIFFDLNSDPGDLVRTYTMTYDPCPPDLEDGN